MFALINDFLVSPFAPAFVLMGIAGVAAGFQWGSRSEAHRIGDDLDMMGRFRIGAYLFEGRCVGHVDDIDGDDDDDGDVKTVDDLARAMGKWPENR